MTNTVADKNCRRLAKMHPSASAQTGRMNHHPTHALFTSTFFAAQQCSKYPDHCLLELLELKRVLPELLQQRTICQHQQPRHQAYKPPGSAPGLTNLKVHNSSTSPSSVIALPVPSPRCSNLHISHINNTPKHFALTNACANYAYNYVYELTTA